MALEETRRQNEETKRDAEALTQLIAHPGWLVLAKLVESVGQNFYVQLITPLESVDGCVKSEYAKGTLNGLQTVMRLPQSKIEESKSLRAPSNEEE